MIELIDDVAVSEKFKKEVAFPYFKDIFKHLVVQSDDSTKGVNKLTILNVSYHL